jgi:hypothetical protein
VPPGSTAPTGAFVGNIAGILPVQFLTAAEAVIVLLADEAALLRVFRLRRRLLHVVWIEWKSHAGLRTAGSKTRTAVGYWVYRHARRDRRGEQSDRRDGTAPAPVRSSSGVDLRAIVAAYIRIQQALHTDTLRGVNAQARVIAATCRRLGRDLDGVRANVASLVQVSELETARAAFALLSAEIMRMARERHARLGAGVRAAWCPMAGQAWLQRSDRVQNPFHGTRMPACGRVLRQFSVVER